MNKAMLIGVLSLFVTMVQGVNAGNLDFEPCVNGGVSASGSYPTQALEDEYGPYGLEPSINGQVSATGLYPTQALEDQYLRKAALIPQTPRADLVVKK